MHHSYKNFSNMFIVVWKSLQGGKLSQLILIFEFVVTSFSASLESIVKKMFRIWNTKYKHKQKLKRLISTCAWRRTIKCKIRLFFCVSSMDMPISSSHSLSIWNTITLIHINHEWCNVSIVFTKWYSLSKHNNKFLRKCTYTIWFLTLE